MARQGEPLPRPGQDPPPTGVPASGTDVEPEEDWVGEQPVTQVELVCDLQASSGTAWFDEASLALRRSPPRDAAAGNPDPARR